MAKHYVPAFTQRLASNTAKQATNDPAKSRITAQGGLTKILEPTKLEHGHSKDTISSRTRRDSDARLGDATNANSEFNKATDYLQRLLDAKTALSVQEKLDIAANSHKGIPRFLDVGYQDDKVGHPYHDSTTVNVSKSTQVPVPNTELNRDLEPQPFSHDTKRLSESKFSSSEAPPYHHRDFSSASLLEFAPPGVFADQPNPWLARISPEVVCGIAGAVFLVAFLVLLGAAKNVLEVVWLSEMKRQGLSLNFYRAKSV